MYCEYCGHQVSYQAVFCEICGQKIRKDDYDANAINSSQIDFGHSINSDDETNNAAISYLSQNMTLGTIRNQTDDQINARSPRIEFEMPKIILGQSMKWFNFFVRYLIPIWVFFGLFSYVNQFFEAFHTVYDGKLSVFLFNEITGGMNILDVIVQITTLIWLIYTRDALKKYLLKGFYLIISYFVFRLIYPLISFLFVIGYVDISEIISIIIAEAIFVLPNIIYFYKRKHILSN